MPGIKEIVSVSLVLFSVIDIIGNVPIIINLRKKVGKIQSGRATIVAGIIMVLFLFLGEILLKLFGIDVGSLAVAGAFIMFLLGMEMVLGIELFKSDPEAAKSASIVPIAFPLIAGPGTITSLISLRAEFDEYTILIGIAINVILIYIVLKSSEWLERKLGKAGFNILRKVFGIILLSIAIKIFKSQITLG